MNERDLRLILTEKCNYRCTFCHNEGIAHQIFKTLNNDDYLFLYDTIKEQQGIKDVSLTGGEPLMYPQIESLCKLLHDRGAKITLVTNGSLLNLNQEIGKRVNRINLSLHSLNQEQYSSITQTRTKLTHILENISLMRKMYPNLLIRLNATIVKGRNDNKEDIQTLVDLADKENLSIKFVELYPNTDPDFIPLEKIYPILEEIGFVKYKENGRKIIYGRGKRIIVLTRISCGSDGEEDLTPSNESDIFISPDGLISPHPSSKTKVSLYDAIKTQNRERLSDLIEQSSSFEGSLLE